MATKIASLLAVLFVLQAAATRNAAPEVSGPVRGARKSCDSDKALSVIIQTIENVTNQKLDSPGELPTLEECGVKKVQLDDIFIFLHNDLKTNFRENLKNVRVTLGALAKYASLHGDC